MKHIWQLINVLSFIYLFIYLFIYFKFYSFGEQDLRLSIVVVENVNIMIGTG